MKPFTFTSKHAIAMQALHCPLCGGGLTRAFTEDAYQCHCGEFRITGEEIVGVQPGQFKQMLRAKLMRCVEIALDLGEKSGYPLLGLKDKKKDKWPWSTVFESTPMGLDYAKYFYDPLIVDPDPPLLKMTPPSYSKSFELIYKDYMKQLMMGKASNYDPPTAKPEIVPKESVKLEALTPALQEFMKDYTK